MNKSTISDLLLTGLESFLEVNNISQSEIFEKVIAKILKMNELDHLIDSGTEDIFKFQFLLLKETDRGVALMSAAYLENSLEFLLKKYFIKNISSKDDPFNKYGFLSSFSSKIDLTYMLGLISYKTKQELNQIRKMRNTFAHSADFIDFDKQSLSDKCDNLNEYKKLEDSSPRDIFIDAVFRLSGIIYTTRLEIDERQEKNDRDSYQFDIRELIPDFKKEFLKELKGYIKNIE